ncbi:MAG TPA: endonuclease/exonuclease/phosphatase family protein [Gaiellaceae bacterium]|nr:endonuclease/exonuclease/phosphatase family protein [Gaiellaceae bacterium]
MRVLLALALAASACLAAAASAGATPGVATVMTQNLYLGTDLDPVLAATTPVELVTAAGAAYSQVEATDFPGRAQALAREIDLVRPDAIGLQEAALWRPGPLGGPATHVAYDFVSLLVEALAARGLHYAPVAVSSNYDAEVPTSLGEDVRLTDRDALLVRTDPSAHVTVLDASAANYAATLELPTALLGTFTVHRSYAFADLSVDGHAFRFVTTHLDPLAPPVQVAQAAELAAGPTVSRLPVVLAGDLNSPADGSGTASYADLLAAGFVDGWFTSGHRDPGYTCCEAGDLRNPLPTLDSRVDDVLTRGDDRVLLEARLGDLPFERTPGGLWPSDHAGVTALVRIGH